MELEQHHFANPNELIDVDIKKAVSMKKKKRESEKDNQIS